MYISQNHATPSKKSDLVSRHRDGACFVHMRVYLCLYERKHLRNDDDKTGKVHPCVRIAETQTKSYIYIYLALFSVVLSTTYEHANYPKEFAGIRSPSAYLKTSFKALSGFREFSSRIPQGGSSITALTR